MSRACRRGGRRHLRPTGREPLICAARKVPVRRHNDPRDILPAVDDQRSPGQLGGTMLRLTLHRQAQRDHGGTCCHGKPRGGSLRVPRPGRDGLGYRPPRLNPSGRGDHWKGFLPALDERVCTPQRR